MISVVNTGPLGVNTFVVPLGGSSCFIVDPACCSSCGDVKKLISFISETSLVPAAIVLTHGHFDHVAGIRFLKDEFNVPVLISREDSVFIGKDGRIFQEKILSETGLSFFLDEVSALPEADSFLEDDKSLLEVFPEAYSSLIKDNPEIKEALSQWKVLFTPGHTKGSVCLYNKKEKLLISGDTVFYHSWGRTDFYGGSETEIQKSLRRIYSEIPEDTKVYPGHDFTGFPLSENINGFF